MSTSTVQLEFESIKILRPKKRWRLYFIVVAEHPTDPSKMVVTTLPSDGSNYIQLKPQADNEVHFEPKGEGADGLFVLQQAMPANRTIKVRVYLRHSRDRARNAGKVLSDLQSGLGSEAFGIVSDILGSDASWLEVSKKAVTLIGGILNDIKDRDFGMVNMDEEFGADFEKQTELDRSNNFSTGSSGNNLDLGNQR